MKFAGGKCSELRFGAGVEGLGPGVERSVALNGWFKGSREINAKPVRQRKVSLRNRGLKSVFVTGISLRTA